MAGDETIAPPPTDPPTRDSIDDLIGDLAVKHGLTRERARMLVDRFGAGRTGLDGAAQDLRSWKN